MRFNQIAFFGGEVLTLACVGGEHLSHLGQQNSDGKKFGRTAASLGTAVFSSISCVSLFSEPISKETPVADFAQRGLSVIAAIIAWVKFGIAVAEHATDESTKENKQRAEMLRNAHYYLHLLHLGIIFVKFVVLLAQVVALKNNSTPPLLDINEDLLEYAPRAGLVK